MEEKEIVLAEEILHDSRYLDQFLAVREDRLDNGMLVGQIVAVGQIPDEVHALLKKDQIEHPESRYFFAKPMEAGSDVRNHYIVKKEE